MQGYVHSIETMGTVDGPGLRYVVFTAGCPLRCKYCHNPDTWNMQNGKKMSSEEIIRDFEKYRPYLRSGGITVTGGEPLVQIDFVTDLFRLAKKRGVHTCLDTSGATFSLREDRLAKFELLCKYTDLVMLDIKHIDAQKYKDLTAGELSETLAFLDFLEAQGTCDIWIRHVILEHWTYDTKYLYRLGYHLGGYKKIKALDVLPYHSMGVNKYEKIGLDYPLKDARAMTKEEAAKARSVMEAGIRDKLLGREAQL
ncbi:MAG: pyruvate formate-lyase-activating protein [Bacillota bacterium]|nr:pyruvate formate-lyase-activating protein [Bacillota bacterium]